MYSKLSQIQPQVKNLLHRLAAEARSKVTRSGKEQLHPRRGSGHAEILLGKRCKGGEELLVSLFVSVRSIHEVFFFPLFFELLMFWSP